MAISDVGLRAGSLIRPIVSTRAQLDDLQRQLVTGKAADSYAGLGPERGATVSLRAQLSAVEGYRSAIDLVDVRLKVGSLALSQFDTLARASQTTIVKSKLDLAGSDQTADQRASQSRLDQMLGLLNTRAGDRYLFSGRATDQPAVVGLDALLNGEGGRAGLKQVMAERAAADRGADGMGRLLLAPAPTGLTLTEDAAGSPFGLKLAAVLSTLSGTTVSGPGGTPAAIAIDMAANPAAGETLTLNVTLPDGTSERLVLKATTSATPAAGEFSIGATPAATRANLSAALTTSLKALVSGAGAAASAVQAGREFFAGDGAAPKRVAGTPFESATALVDGTDANTLRWYTGETGSDDARATAAARIDQSLSVGYGMRADEEALRNVMQSLAVFAASSFSDTSADGVRYGALAQRVATNLAGTPGAQTVPDVTAELGSAQALATAARERHGQTKVTLDNFLSSIEGVSKEEVAAKILALQTSLQASLQTTAMMLRTNLLQYL